MILLNNINRIYKVGSDEFFALRDVDLEIDDGDFVSVCGASGSGKTTLLNIIGCLDDPSSGSYWLCGEQYSDLKGYSGQEKRVEVGKLSSSVKALIRNEKIGFVLQDFALINTQTVLYNVMLPLLYSKVPYSKIKGMALNALRAVGIEDQASKKANQLSGGQRQRVAIARAIVNDPCVILADEPTGQLDSKCGLQIMELLGEINSKGTTVVVVTHDQNVASKARRIIRVSDGRIVE